MAGIAAQIGKGVESGGQADQKERQQKEGGQAVDGERQRDPGRLPGHGDGHRAAEPERPEGGAGAEQTAGGAERGTQAVGQAAIAAGKDRQAGPGAQDKQGKDKKVHNGLASERIKAMIQT